MEGVLGLLGGHAWGFRFLWVQGAGRGWQHCATGWGGGSPAPAAPPALTDLSRSSGQSPALPRQRFTGALCRTAEPRPLLSGKGFGWGCETPATRGPALLIRVCVSRRAHTRPGLLLAQSSSSSANARIKKGSGAAAPKGFYAPGFWSLPW